MTPAAVLVLLGMLGGRSVQNATPDLDRKVTFACRAQRAVVMLPELGKVAGVALSAAPSIESEVLVVSVKEVPIGELMKRVAVVTSGEWRTEAGGYRLYPATGLRDREERDALRARTVAIAKSIADKVAAAKKAKEAKPAAGDAATEAQVAMAQSMAMMGDPNILPFLSSVDPAELAAIGNNERVVFSTQPTKTQQPFTGDMTQAVNALISAHNASVTHVDDAQLAQLDQLPSSIRGMSERMIKPIGNVSKALLVVSQAGFGGVGIMPAELRLYDPDGKVAFSQPSMLDMPGSNFSDLIEQATASLPGSAKTAKPATKETPIDISPETKEFMASLGGVGFAMGKSMHFSADLREKLYNPARFDPLAFLATDEVVSLAKKLGQPLVAALPDDALNVMSNFMPAQTTTVEAFEKKLAKGNELQQVADRNWLLIKPANAAAARANRTDRVALTKLLKSARAKGMPSLDDVAAYSLTSPSPMEGGVGMLYVMILTPGAFTQGVNGVTSWELLRFYGSLDPELRTVLADGKRLPISALTPYQASQVNRMAYGATPMLDIEDPSRKSDDALPGYMRMFTGGSGTDYRDEPTEILPNGLPADGYVELKVSTDMFASPVTPDGDVSVGPMSVLDPEMLATVRLLKENKEMAQASAMFSMPAKARLGHRSVLSFTFQVLPKVAIHSKLYGHQLDKNADIISMDSLPPDFQKQVDAQYEIVKKSPIGSLLAGMAGMMGGPTGIRP